jgi:cytochrome c553
VQRATVADQACIVCDTHAGHCDPAHIISRAALTDGQDDPRAVVALCRSCHDGYDERGGDLLPYLEPRHRAELAFAVERYGLIRTLERVTNQRWGPVPS